MALGDFTYMVIVVSEELAEERSNGEQGPGTWEVVIDV